jgi:hypothetical protein
LNCERDVQTLSAIVAPVAESRVQVVQTPAGFPRGENAVSVTSASSAHHLERAVRAEFREGGKLAESGLLE